MSRTHAIAWAALAAAVCGGCVVQSLSPFFTESLRIEVSGVEGKWLLTKNVGSDVKEPVKPWVIERAKNSPPPWYSVTSYDVDNVEGILAAIFYKVGDDLYCDISSHRGGLENRYWRFNLIQTHVLGKVVLKDDVLRFEMLSRDWIEEALQRKEIDLPVVRRGRGGVILNATSKDWVAFLEKHAKTDGVFDTHRVTELKRIPEPAPGEKRAPEDKDPPKVEKDIDGSTNK